MTADQARAIDPWRRVVHMAVTLQRTVAAREAPCAATAEYLRQLEAVAAAAVLAARALERCAEAHAGVEPGAGVADG